MKHLKERGLSEDELVISDACLGLVESVVEVNPAAPWQRCVVHWYRNAFSHVPSTKMREVALMLKAIHPQACRRVVLAKAEDVIAKLKAMRLAKVARWLEETFEEAVVYYAFPDEHWPRVRTNNTLERIMREIRIRTHASPISAAAAQCGRLPHRSDRSDSDWPSSRSQPCGLASPSPHAMVNNSRSRRGDPCLKRSLSTINLSVRLHADV